MPTKATGGGWAATVAVLAGACVAPAAQGQVTSRVEVPGSSVAGGAASPSVTVIRADELARAGVLTAEQALRRIAANQNDKGLAQGVGELTGGMAEADLRGLGATKTLVLLNGRRLSNHAYDGGAVDLHAIPMALLDRIEVQREGASAIYGGGAIAGVINFILRRDLQGFELSAVGEQPQHAGGGTANLSVTAGFGELSTGGMNISTTLDLRRQQAIAALDRPYSKSGVQRAADGKVLQFRTGSTSFPGDLDGFDPSLATGCAPPVSIPDPDGTGCRYDFMRDLDLLPQNEQSTWLTQAALVLGPKHSVTLEYLRAQNRTQARQGPAPVEMFIPRSSPFWIAGRPSEPFDGLGLGGIADWLTAPAGRRSNSSRSVAQRALVSLQGEAAGIDYSAALGFARSDVSDTLGSGHVNLERIRRGLQEGHINPFGAQSAAGLAAFREAAVDGKLLSARGDVGWLDMQLNHHLTPLDGGPLAFSLGLELRRERFDFDVQPLAALTADPGFDLAIDTRGARQAGALFGQLQAPFTPTLTAGLAARIDRFDDTGRIGSGKLSLNWQPAGGLLLRVSLGTNFRVPTLYETRLPAQLAESGESFDDPVYCPGGVPLPGLAPGQACGQQLQQRSGGPAAFGLPLDSLRAERSRNALVGLVFQPNDQVRLGIDFWGIQLRDQIEQLPVSTLFNDPSRYAARLVRCSQLDSAARAAIDSCLNSAFDAIAYVDTPLENLGDVRAQGIDLSLALNSGATPAGEFSFNADGTYVSRYDSQVERGGPYSASAGRFAIDAPIFRWQHVAQASWLFGRWTAALSQRYLSGYVDQDPTRKVAAYALWDTSISYAGWKNWQLSLGVKNVFDRQPPFSNQSETAQANYDPRYTDPTGRAWWLRVLLSF